MALRPWQELPFAWSSSAAYFCASILPQLGSDGQTSRRGQIMLIFHEEK